MRKIIHVDMDYFYAQVEELDKPELKSKPFAVGGSYSGKGVICTSNYVAREYGVRSAMSSFLAMRKCPQVIFIKPNFEKYTKKSQIVFSIFARYTDKIQKLSLDEAYLDVTDCPMLGNDAVAIAKQIKREIFKETGLTASAGVSYNKLLAKIGSDLFKPNGLAVLRPENIEKNIRHFKVEKIQGVGSVTAQRLHQLGLYTFGDLQNQSKAKLVNYFGDFGVSLYNYCRGIDHKEVNGNRVRKSLSVENTFSHNLAQKEDILLKLDHTFEELKERLQKHSEKEVKNLVVKLRYHDFQTSTVEANKLFEARSFQDLFLSRWEERKEPIRLLGLGVKFKVEKKLAKQMEFQF